ncbi:armadillo-type protein [Radiomyces spectabilis]|uniref:armadillo-type protein n=1 Tax=Radiomyces spectabilis TaxID=64574 RepID=UPI0022205EAB|nr:armadillo-type protein [Radiomyces spectabilis]KAI8376232.1 armadillo-type protein [Radiomyces spectabilis]
MAHWQPQQQGLRELLILLRGAIQPEGRDQALVQQKLASFNEIPDYNSYLVYILTKMPQEESYTRAIAGLTLKNNIRSFFNTIPLHVLDYIKTSCIEALHQPDPDVNIRKTVGSVITAIVTRGQVHNWPDILRILMEKLDSPDPVTVEMAFDTLGKVCEDAARDLDQEIEGDRPLNYMIPKFITFFHNPDPRLRVQAMAATSQFVLLRSQSLMTHMDQFLAGLFARATDENAEVRQEICRSLVMVLEARPDKLAPSLPSIVEYMLYCTQDDNEQVALEACDFWLQFVNVRDFHDRLLPYLDRIVPVLLKRMVYSEMDLLMFSGDEEDAHVADDEQSIKPRFYRYKHGQAKRDTQSKKENKTKDELKAGETEDDITSDMSDDESLDEEDEDDEDDDDDLEDDEFFSEWTLRKCSAAALDVLTSTYKDKVVHILLPLLNQNLFSQDWKERESGILALGAAAEGGVDTIAPHLPQLMPYLLQSLNDTKPLIRSITCWAIGRFSRWCVDQCVTPEGRGTFFEPVLYSLLQRMLDKNKRVQEAACSAFAMLEEEATLELVPYLEPILVNLTTAFRMYQHKNLLILYDALGTLAESVGSALNHPRCLSLMMPPLIAKWNDLSDQDTDLFPLLECLSSITAALGTGFALFAEPVFTRCVKLVASTLHETYLADQQPHMMEPPDVGFMVVALDLLSGMVQGMGAEVDPLVAKSDPPILSLLAVCIHDPVTEVLQSTYALIGDLAIACFERLRSYLPAFLTELLQQVGPNFQNVSVCNNAIWAAGEIAIRWLADMEPFVKPLLERLFPLLVAPEIPNSLRENAMITIGRLGLACPSIVAAHLPQFIKPWLAVSFTVRENGEKDSAFQGFCELIKANPEAGIQDIIVLMKIIGQWQLPTPPLFKQFNEILMGYKNLMPEEQWQAVVSALTPDVRQVLSQRYGGIVDAPS